MLTPMDINILYLFLIILPFQIIKPKTLYFVFKQFAPFTMIKKQS